MRKIVVFLVCLSPLLLVAQPLQELVLAQQQHPALQGAWWGGLAMYADKPNEELFSVLADTRFAPASTLKLLTTAAALEKFGPDHRFETRLYASALPDENGILNGNLYVRGGGDMTLGSQRVKGSQPYPQVLQEWVRVIKKAGINQINGTIVADVSLFEGPTIADKVNWENIGNYFAAPASALCFNDNLFSIHFKGELGHGQRVEVKSTSPEIPGVDIQSFVTADSKNKKDNAYVYGAPDQYNLKIFGTIPTTLSGFTIQAAMPNSALFAVQALEQALAEEGVRVSGEPQVIADAPDYDSMYLLDTHLSPTLKDIIFIVNKRSFNLYADMLLRQLAVADGQKGSIKNGLTSLNHFLREHNLAQPNDTVLYDGSGLSRDNMLTPRVLVNTLVFMMQSPHFGYYYRSLATPNDRGDLLVLRRFLKPSHRVEDVRLKGGTIDGVKALAGYVPNAQGRLVAFAFIANNLATNKDESLWRMHEDLIKRFLEQKTAEE